MKRIAIVLAAFTLISVTAFSQKKSKVKLSKMDKEFLDKQPNGMYAKFETNKGNIFTALEFKKTPMTVANFVGLAEGGIKNTARPEGKPYYDGLVFHRVIDNFMVQGGCPQGTGMGDPGYKFGDEFHDSLKHTGPGILSMANAGPGTNGSQFFITHTQTAWLDGKHTVFGHVVQGQDVVNTIKQGDSIRHLTILRKGAEAEAFNAPSVFENENKNYSAKQEEKRVAEDKKRHAEQLAQEGVINERYGKFTSTPTGLKYSIEKPGTGAAPTATSQVTVHYTGTLLNGKVFDSSVERGQPVTFGLNQVIPGWTEGVQLLKPGGKIKLVIPPALGYGDGGYPPVIPPKSWLVFDVELIAVDGKGEGK